MKIDIQHIKKILPHRYPFLLIDKTINININNGTIITQKNITANENFFPGHFPYYPVMPGVLILEAMAQASALCSFSDQFNKWPNIYYFVGIDADRFRKPVIPGDQLHIEVKTDRLSCNICKYQGRALVNTQLVAEAKLMCTIRNLES